MRDHLLGFPGVLALIEPDAKPSHRTPPRIRVIPQYIADSREQESDRPGRVVSWPAITRGGGKTFGERKEERIAARASPSSTKPEGVFKVGDRVRILRCDHSQPQSMVGKICVVGRADGHLFTVACDDHDFNYWFNPTEVERAAEPTMGEDGALLADAPGAVADAEGWIAYSGQCCPLPIGANFEYRTAGGETGKLAVSASSFMASSFWNHDPDDAEDLRKSWLLSYRIVKQ